MPLPATETADVNAARPVQLASLGPYKLNVIDPVGLTPPLKAALSLIALPRGAPAEAVVTTLGVA